VLRADFREVAVRTLVPAAHLGWTAAWFGGARGAYVRVMELLRGGSARERRRMGSELFVSRLAEVRLTLDLLESMLLRLLDRYEELRAEDDADAFRDAAWSIALNNLKVAGSRLAFSAADGLVSALGMSRGYLRGGLGLERVFRDLRSAPLMYGNDELLAVNGALMLLEDRG